MKTKLQSLIPMTLLLLSVSCKKPVGNQAVACLLEDEMQEEQDRAVASSDQDDEETEAPRLCDLPTPDADANLDVKAKLRNFDDGGEEKMRKALKRLKIVVNSEEFKDKIINYTYQGEFKFVDNDGLTNEEIYQKIMEGAEVLLPEIDEEMDLDITLYWKRGGVVGYTYPNTIKIWTNGNFFYGFTYGQVASNAIHEWTHKIGFDHAYNSTSSRPYSVPYAVGGIVSGMIDTM